MCSDYGDGQLEKFLLLNSVLVIYRFDRDLEKQRGSKYCCWMRPSWVYFRDGDLY